MSLNVLGKPPAFLIIQDNILPGIKTSAISDISVKHPPNCTILDNWFFQNFTLVDELFAKALRIFETCVLVNNNLCGN